MFSIDKLNRIKLTKGDSASFHLDVMEDDGTVYKMRVGDVLQLILSTYAGQTALTLTADSQNYFTFLPSSTSSLTDNFYNYKIVLTTVDGQVYTMIDDFFELEG